MALACSKCSTENADGALVCRGCGAALPPPASWSRSLLPEDDHFDPLSAPTLVMQHTAPATLPPIEETAVPMPPGGGGGRRLMLGVAGLVVLVAAGAWLLRPGELAPPLPAAAAPAASSVASAAPSASVAATTPEAAASAAALPLIVAPASAPQAAMPAASAAPPAASPASVASPASDARKRIPEPVARKRALAAPPAASSPMVPAAPPPTPEPVAAPVAAPERPKTVAELCASGNLITRGFCEQRECRRGEHANDPVCARLKDAEQRRLFQQ